jgi:hypothetical protein
VIKWSQGGLTSVRIEYTITDDTGWVAITDPFPASNGQYSWRIPNTPSPLCRVRLKSASNPAISDVSDLVFTIAVNELKYTKQKK